MHESPGVERFERESERGGEEVGESLTHAGGWVGGERGDAVLGLGFGGLSVMFDDVACRACVLHELAYGFCARLERLGRGLVLLPEVAEIGDVEGRAWGAGAMLCS